MPKKLCKAAGAKVCAQYYFAFHPLLVIRLCLQKHDMELQDSWAKKKEEWEQKEAE